MSRASYSKKIERACGGCLGVYCRWRTWETAICFGELSTKRRPEDLRMGKPGGLDRPSSNTEYI